MIDIIGFAKHGAKLIYAFGERNMPTILTGAGLIGFGLSIYEACTATPRYMEILEDYEEQEEPVKVTRRASDFLVTYGKTIVIAASATAAIILANKINMNKIATLTAGVTIGQQKLKEYTEKSKEIFGPKADKIEQAIAHDKISAVDTTTAKIYDTGHGDTLIMDSITKMVFKDDLNFIRKQVNEMNEEAIAAAKSNPFYDDHVVITQNDFRMRIGLPEIDIGENLGSDYNDHGLFMVDLESASVTKDGVPCIYMKSSCHPINNWAEVVKTPF